METLESGVPVVRAADGQDVAVVGTAQMSDASIDPATGLPGTLKRVDSSLTAGLPGAASLTLRPDAAFLADPATKYPVTIDPTVVPNLTDNLDTMVVNGALANNNYDGDQYLYVGFNSNYGTLARSYLRFNNGSIKPNGGPNKVVTNAKLKLVQNTSAGCGARRDNIRAAAGLTTGKTWNTKPAIYGNPTSYSYTGDNKLLTMDRPTLADGTNYRTSYVYDAAGRKTTAAATRVGASSPDGGTQTFDWYANGLAKTETGQDGTIISRCYDADGSLLETNQGTSAGSCSSVDGRTVPTSVTASATHLIRGYYLDNQVRTADDGTHPARYSWDGLGQTASGPGSNYVGVS